MKRFTQIKGLSAVRRIPRLGRVRLGVKVKNKAGKEYPKETPWFVVPPEVAKVYGEKPTELDIMIPVEDTNVSFPQAYIYFGSSRGVKCTGDGEVAMRSLAFHAEYTGDKSANSASKELIEVPCTCELFDQGKCKQSGYFQVLLPKVSVGGVYAIVTSSYNSIVDLNSGIDYVRAMIGRVAMVPLKLKREPKETHFENKKQVHYTMRIELEGDINFLNNLRENTSRILSGPQPALEPPTQENPELDAVDVIEEEGEPEAAKPETPPAKQAKPAEKPPIEGHAERMPEQQAKGKGPTKAELLEKIKTSKNPDDWNQCLADAAHLPEDDCRAVRMAVIHRGKEVAANRGTA